jgi:hypothetical protein
MYYVHTAGAPPPAPGSAVPVLACLGVLLAGLAVLALRARRSGHPALRACPMCAALAVRTSAAEEVGGGLVRLQLQCGQCGIWRRGVARAAEIEAYERALARDRRRIGDEAVRLVRERARRELDAFVRALRSEVVGADDFLARARRSLSRGQGLG